MIEVQNLTKRYGEFSAVDRISFSVPKGEIFGFLGPNGAGKTTTIKMLTTMLKPTEGSIRVDGFDPLRDQGAVRRTFGIVFQDPSLDEALTAFENMELHAVLYRVDPRERRERIEKLLRFVELWDRRADFVKRFSGGMKRRLEIARALLHEPKIMFLDEPTLGLDPADSESYLELYRKLKQGTGRHGLFHDALHGRGGPCSRRNRSYRSRENRCSRLSGEPQGESPNGFARRRFYSSHRSRYS